MIHSQIFTHETQTKRQKEEGKEELKPKKRNYNSQPSMKSKERTYLTGRQDVVDPVLVLAILDIESGGQHADLVDSPDQVNHNLPSTVVVHNLELADVA